MDNKNYLEVMRHSMAHIMASAITHLWEEVKLGVGPVVEDGFYYDIDLGNKTISNEDFEKIETEMKKIIEEDQPFVMSEMSIEDAINWAKENNQPYKLELLNDLKAHGTTSVKEIEQSELGLTDQKESVDRVSFYTNGDFTDLCHGPHVESTSKVGSYKLIRVSGAYWRGKNDNPQMQRVYGIAFNSKEELDEYIKNQELAKQLDHRVIGEKLNLFFFSDEIGAGLPLLTPRGERIKYRLMEYMRSKEEALGFQYVATPVLTQSKLYELSGHASYYSENMYVTETDEEGNKFYIKPMNCPHHHMIYSHLVNSYRDLPLRLSEQAGLYRYELSGTLTGLIRVRGPITQNDSHIYVSPDQVKGEFNMLLNLLHEVYKELGINGYWFRLSLPDFEKTKYAGDRSRWEEAAQVIRESLKETNSEYVEEPNEAAFYGPKLDIQIKNISNKEDTVATIQLDILVPERMGLTYVDSNSQKQHPLVIHKSIMGAFERFMAFLLEQTGGNLPIWLSPEHFRVITLNQHDDVIKMANEVKELAGKRGVIAVVDDENESVGKKIRNAELMKIPFTLVIGPKELESRQIHPRPRKDLRLDKENYQIEEFIDFIAAQLK